MESDANEKTGCASGGSLEGLAPLSDNDFELYNHLAELMDQYHTHFRRMWNVLWSAVVEGKRPEGMTLTQLLNTGLQFAGQLTAHHLTEEHHVFPALARKMPEFDSRRSELLEQHAHIHNGLERLESYLIRCKGGEVDFEMYMLRNLLDSFRETLWTHLDQEVATLGAENMRRYWSKDELHVVFGKIIPGYRP